MVCLPKTEVIAKSRGNWVLGQRSRVLGADLSQAESFLLRGTGHQSHKATQLKEASMDLRVPNSDSSHVTTSLVEHRQCTPGARWGTKMHTDTCVWSCNLSYSHVQGVLWEQRDKVKQRANKWAHINLPCLCKRHRAYYLLTFSRKIKMSGMLFFHWMMTYGIVKNFTAFQKAAFITA